jgi:prepilin-type processing-associated H-X9-DG protein
MGKCSIAADFLRLLQDDGSSYGINGWVESPPPDVKTVYEGFETVNNWRTPIVRGAGYIPLLFDAMRFNIFPLATDTSPPAEDMAWQGTQHMRRACIDRHNGFINSAFLDWSVRKIGLKELWTLKWHKNYNVNGQWTKAGSATPAKWPQWMRHYKDY